MILQASVIELEGVQPFGGAMDFSLLVGAADLYKGGLTTILPSATPICNKHSKPRRSLRMILVLLLKNDLRSPNDTLLTALDRHFLRSYDAATGTKLVDNAYNHSTTLRLS